MVINMANPKKKTGGAATPLPQINEERLKELAGQVRELKNYIASSQQPRVLKTLLSALLDCSAQDVCLVVDEGLQPRTDGKTIWVSMLPDLLEEKWQKFWGVLFQPITAHEAQHKNSSDFKDMEEIRKWYGEEMEKNGFKAAIGESIAGDFLNAVEDGRIEKISADRHPGLVIPYRFLNDCIREGCTIEEKAEDTQKEYHHFFGQILSYAKTGLYAPGCAAYVGTRLESNFFAVQQHVDMAIDARTSRDCRNLVQSMLMDLMPYLAELLKDSEDLQEELENQEKKNEYQGAKEKELNDGGDDDGNGGAGDGVRAKSPAGFGHFSMDDGGGKSGDGGSDEEGTNYGFGGANDGSDKGYTPDQLAEMEQAAKTMIQNAQQQEVQEGLPPEMDGLSKDEIDKLISECYARASHSFKEEWMKYPQVALPLDIVQEATALRKELLRLIQTRKARQGGRKSGVLDTKVLWKTGVGARDLFFRPGRKDTDSCVFYLLIDNSSSMSENCGRNVEKSFAARRAAAVIEEALKGIVPVKVSLFECSGNTRHISLKTFDSKSKINACYASLSVIQPSGYNADSVHIRVAAKELLNRPERKKFLFVLSDGMPSAYGSKESGEQEVHNAVEDARRKGVVVIPIMFGSDSFRQSYAASFEKMYSKNLLSCDPREIGRRLPELFKRLIIMS